MVRKLLILLMLLAVPLQAQLGGGVQVSASLSSQSIPLDGSANLTISISGSADGINVPTPETQDGGLRFISAGRRYQMSNINGQTTTSTQYDFVVMPLKTGRFLIEPMTVVVAGVAHTTASQRLEVTDMAGSSGSPSTQQQAQTQTTPGGFPSGISPWGQPTGWPSSPRPEPREDDILLESEIAPEVVYKHQAVTHTLTLLTAVRLLNDPRYNAIAPTGFLRVPFDQVNGVQERGGRTYDTSSVKMAFFPLNEGDYTFNGTQIQVTSGDFGLPRILRTQPQAIKVLPLPSEGKPKSFTGAVGTRFDLHARLKQNTVTLGNSVELEISVEGDGHLDLVPYPYLPQWQSLEKKLGKSPSSTRAENGRVVSQRTYNYRIKPSKEGTYELSGIVLSFFNTQDKRYETVLAPTLVLNVEPNPNAAPAGQASMDLSERPESERPVELAGPSAGRLPHLPLRPIALGLALMVIGTLLGRPGRLLPRPKRWGGKPRFGPHSSVKEFLASLDKLAPGADRQARAAHLKNQGWSSERSEKLEAIRQQANRALFGGGREDSALLKTFEQDLQQLLKEKTR